MGGEDYGGAFVLQAKDLLADYVRVHGIEAGEGFVQDKEGGLVHHGGDELELLGHSLGQFLYLLVPPVLDAKADEPFLEGFLCLGFAHSLETGQIHCLVANFHLAVKAAFLRHIANLFNILLGDWPVLEIDLSAGRDGNAVYDSDQRCLAGSVGAKQTKNLSFRDFKRDIVQRYFWSERLAHSPDIY